MMHCCIPTLTTDSNTNMGMIRVRLNMLSAAEECREPSGNYQGISLCLESGHPVLSLEFVDCEEKCECVTLFYCSVQITASCYK